MEMGDEDWALEDKRESTSTHFEERAIMHYTHTHTHTLTLAHTNRKIQ